MFILYFKKLDLIQISIANSDRNEFNTFSFLTLYVFIYGIKLQKVTQDLIFTIDL